MSYYSPSMVNTQSLLKMRVPPALHSTFISIFPKARWNRREEVYVVKSSSPNLQGWTKFLDVAGPAIEALEEVGECQAEADSIEQAEESARKALEEARDSLMHAKARTTRASYELEDLLAELEALKPSLETAYVRKRCLEAEVGRLAESYLVAIAPAIELCDRHQLKRALDDLEKARVRDGEPTLLQLSAQARIRSLQDALRQIGFRHRRIDAIAQVTLASNWQLDDLVRRAKGSAFNAGFESIARDADGKHR